jgi:4-oxalocrotonate tautomerase
MPFIQVYAYAGRTEDQKRKLVQGITQAVCDAYDVPPEHVSIYLHDMARGDTAHAGVLGSDVTPVDGTS